MDTYAIIRRYIRKSGRTKYLIGQCRTAIDQCGMLCSFGIDAFNNIAPYYETDGYKPRSLTTWMQNMEDMWWLRMGPSSS